MYKKRSYESAHATTIEVLFGEKQEFTVYAESKWSNRCSATGTMIPVGAPIAMYVDDTGKKRYVGWPLPASTRKEKANPFSHLVLDRYQQAVFDTLRKSSQHILIDAKAGSGKSTVLCYSLAKQHESLGKCCAMAFGVKDSERFKMLLPSAVESRTTHSFGLVAIKSHWNKVKVTLYRKNDAIFTEVIGQKEENRKTWEYVQIMIGKAKADAAIPGTGMLPAVVLNYHLETEIPKELHEEIIKLTEQVLKLSLNV